MVLGDNPFRAPKRAIAIAPSGRLVLGQVHADPELEADVFEELDEDRATRLPGARTDSEIARVLSRMRAGDTADAVAELPQHRRQAVVDLMPAGQRTSTAT
jgi:Mg/Co/Ni transporter MgtE